MFNFPLRIYALCVFKDLRGGDIRPYYWIYDRKLLF